MPHDRKLIQFYNPGPKIRGLRAPKNRGPKTRQISVILYQCKLTQFYLPCGSRVRFSGSFATWRCCERNFEYLNWLSTRTCAAGRPHVGLCHLPCLLLKSEIHDTLARPLFLLKSGAIQSIAWRAILSESTRYT